MTRRDFDALARHLGLKRRALLDQGLDVKQWGIFYGTVEATMAACSDTNRDFNGQRFLAEIDKYSRAKASA